MSIWSSITGVFSKSSGTGTAATTALNAVATANPSIAPYIAIASQILSAHATVPNSTSSTSTNNTGGPIAPTEAQLAAALQAKIMAENNYSQLIQQVKAVAAYDTAMRDTPTAQIGETGN